MRNEMVFKDSRLLEALDYIDRGLIAEAVDGLRLTDSDGRASAGKRKTFLYAAVLAACLVLMSAVIPVVGYLIERFPAGSSYAYELTYPMFVEDLEPLSDEEMVKINEVYEDWKYEQLYERYSSSVIGDPDNADEQARNELGDDPHRFFNKERYRNYQYYGKFGDCIVLATQDNRFVLMSINVAGYNFKLGGSTAGLAVYRDGEMMTLHEAYSAGYMTDSQIGAVHERYLAYMEYLNEPKDAGTAPDISIYTPPEPTEEPIFWEFMPSLEPLTRDQMNEIRKAYAEYRFRELYSTYYRQYTALNELDNIEARAYENAKSHADKEINKLFSGSHYYSRYYGIFDGWAVVAVVDDTLTVTEYYVADTSIRFPQGAEMYVYRDGEIMEFEEFYKKGLMSDYDATLLSTRHLIYEAMSQSSMIYLYDSYLEPIKDIEPLTREQIGDIRSAFANYVYMTVIDECESELVARYGEKEGRVKALLKAGNESKTAYNLLFGDDINAARYYGIIDGYVVFAVADVPRMIVSDMKNVDSLLASVEATMDMYVYSFDNNMVFKYYSRYLSDEGVNTLEKRQSEYRSYLNGSTLELLLESYFGKSIHDEDGEIILLFQTGKCLVAGIATGEPESTSYEVGDYKLNFPNGVKLIVGRYGETHDLNRAYLIRYITDADMSELYDVYLDYCEKENK